MMTRTARIRFKNKYEMTYLYENMFYELFGILDEIEWNYWINGDAQSAPHNPKYPFNSPNIQKLHNATKIISKCYIID